MGRNVLRSLWAILGTAEREVVRVCLVAIACTPDIFTAARTLAMSAASSRSEVVGVGGGGNPLVLSDGDKFEVPGAPEIFKACEHRRSAMNVAEVLEGDIGEGPAFDAHTVASNDILHV